MDKRLNNLIGLKNRRKELRKHLTPTEVRLWGCLKNNQLGYKFRRQHSFGYYILDFYCPFKKLAVELDGSPHDTMDGYVKDRHRDLYLQDKRLTVIRFQNKEVINNLEGVLTAIRNCLR